MFLWQDVVSDHCYLSFDPFSSTVDFFKSYAMREVKGLSLSSYGFVFSSPRFAPLSGLCWGSLLFSKYSKSFGFKEYFTGTQGSVNKQDFSYEQEAWLLSTKPPHQKFYLAVKHADRRANINIFRGVNISLFS